MHSTNSMRLTLTWAGTEYQCLADMSACMRIEERVVLHVLADRVIRGPDNVPASHACWVLYCLLERAGAPITADDVYEAAKNGLVDNQTFETILRWLVAEVYGQGPEPEKKSKPAPRRRATRKPSAGSPAGKASTRP